MDRSRYPSRVVVRSGDLSYTESSKAAAILERFTATAKTGIVDGLVLSQATELTRFDLSSGYGFAPNGEKVSLSVDADSQSLSTTAREVPVMVGLMLREVQSKAGASDTDGVARPRRTENYGELKSYTAAQYDLLPATYPSDLSVDARDRFLVVGVVTLPALSTDPLTIVQPAAWNVAALTIEPTTISGAVITDLSSGTTPSDPFPLPGDPSSAVLSFDPSTGEATYQAPHDTAPGSAVVLIDGENELTSTGGDSITLQVDTSLLPASTSSTVTDSLTVAPLYRQVAPRQTALDEEHREMRGSQPPSTTNPHGLRLSDILTLVEAFLGTTNFGTVYQSPTGAERPAIRVPPSDATSSSYARAQLLFEAPGNSALNPSPRSFRIYRTELDTLQFVMNAWWDNEATADGQWTRDAVNGDDSSARAIMLELSGGTGGLALYVCDTGASSWNSVAGPGGWTRIGMQYDNSSNTFSVTKLTVGDTSNLEDVDVGGNLSVDGLVTLQGLLELGLGYVSDSADVLLARITSRVSNTYRTLVEDISAVAGLTAESVLRYYAPISGPSLSPGHETTLNATWNGSAWEKVNDSYASWKQAITRSGFDLLYRAVGSGSWADTAWTSILRSSSIAAQFYVPLGVTGNVTASTGFDATASASQNGLYRGVHSLNPHTYTQNRMLITEVVNSYNGLGFRKYVLYNLTGAGYSLEETINARWDNASQLWVPDDNANQARLYVNHHINGPQVFTKYSGMPSGGFGDSRDGDESANDRWDASNYAAGTFGYAAGYPSGRVFRAVNVGDIGIGGSPTTAYIRFRLPLITIPNVNLSYTDCTGQLANLNADGFDVPLSIAGSSWDITFHARCGSGTVDAPSTFSYPADE